MHVLKIVSLDTFKTLSDDGTNKITIKIYSFSHGHLQNLSSCAINKENAHFFYNAAQTTILWSMLTGLGGHKLRLNN